MSMENSQKETWMKSKLHTTKPNSYHDSCRRKEKCSTCLGPQHDPEHEIQPRNDPKREPKDLNRKGTIMHKLKIRLNRYTPKRINGTITLNWTIQETKLPIRGSKRVSTGYRSNENNRGCYACGKTTPYELEVPIIVNMAIMFFFVSFNSNIIK